MMTRDVLQNLGRLLCSWWKVDRIRVAATTGRLFQLAPGDRLLIGEQLFVVRKRSLLKRSLETDSDEACDLGVEYRLINLSDHANDGAERHAGKVLLNADKECQLQVLLANDSHPNVHRFQNREVIEELLEDQIVVLRSPGRR